MYPVANSGFSALIWEDTIWLSNGAQVPIKDVIIDSTTGRILRTITSDDKQKSSTDPYRWTTGHTVDITGLLTFDEANALRASAKAFDLGSPTPSKKIVNPVSIAAIGSLVLLGVIWMTTRKKHVS